MLYYKILRKIVGMALLITLLSVELRAQNVQVKGAVVDTSAKANVPEASVVLLRAKDSVLVTDTRSNKEGIFSFNDVKSGSYILLITHHKFVDFVEKFDIDSRSQVKSFDKIYLTQKSVLLQEVAINFRKAAAIRFKGDTLEFAADSFKVQPNASVEDLLSRLPGLQVDRNGQITAQGKKIDKVLVDGEEFFGDDPTLVTRNLKASMVDKVQLYDKTSNQAAFTGVSDGKTTKTLDLKLKEEVKHGIFGKIELGIGSNGFYQNQANFNSFNGDEKLAAYFILSNTGKIGLDRRSQLSYAGGDANAISTDLSNWSGSYDGVGIPRSISGGVQYDNKWNEDKHSVNANYKFNGLEINGERNSILQNNLPGSILYSVSSQDIKNRAFRHGANVAYNIKPDATSELKLNFEGSWLNRTTHEDNDSETRGENQVLVNNRMSNVGTNGNISAFNSNVLWQKKFSKERRSLSFNFNAKINTNIATGFFYTQSNFFTNGTISGAETVDQYKTTNNEAQSFNLKGTYTEPIGTWGSIVGNYGIYKDNAKSALKTFNKSGAGTYTILDNLYSNSYVFNQLSNRGGIAYVFNKKKVRIQVGSDVALTQFDQRNVLENISLKRNFTNWFPSAQFRYNAKSGAAYSLNYSGNTNQPAIQQLQSVVNNIDPLNIFVGNNTLTPSFTNSFSGGYSLFKGVKTLFSSVNISSTSNPITLSTETDSFGKSTNSYVNLSDATILSYSASVLYRDKIKGPNIDWGVDGSVSGAKYASRVNGLTNFTDASTYQLNFVLSKLKDTSYSVGVMLGPSYNINKSKLQPQLSNNSWGYVINPFFEIYLPGKLQLNTTAVYTWQGKTQTFNADFSRLIWDAWVGKKLLKDNRLMVKLSVYDILNQNVGFNRNAYNNIISQSNYTTIARYFAASVVWDFNRTGKSKIK
jgi:hypothetical protein